MRRGTDCLDLLRLLAVFPLLAAAPVASHAQQACPPRAPEVWVTIDGREQYRLADGRRLPPGQLAALHGYPRGDLLPDVWLRRSDQGEPIKLNVVDGANRCSWSVPLPALPPLIQAELTVTSYRGLTKAERAVVRTTFIEMLGTLARGFTTGEIVLGVSMSAYRQSVERYLTERFPPASTLPGLALVDRQQPRDRTLGEQLIAILADADTLSIVNTLTDYGKALNFVLDRRVVNDTTLPGLDSVKRRGVDELLEAIGPAFLQVAAGRRERVAALMQRDPPLVPLPGPTLAALRALWTGSPLRPQAEEQLRLLATPVEERLRDLFAAMAAATSVSYNVSSTSDAFRIGDLRRYGTIDFVTGRITGGSGSTRGFVTLSFFPGDPQPRTPESALRPLEGGRYALTIGYSVTGGEKDSVQYLLAGLTVRMNRYLSLTAAVVAPEHGGKVACCFAGLAGDLTAVPFLKDLFVDRPKEED